MPGMNLIELYENIYLSVMGCFWVYRLGMHASVDVHPLLSRLVTDWRIIRYVICFKTAKGYLDGYIRWAEPL